MMRSPARRPLSRTTRAGEADAGGVDDDAVDLAAAHDFRVAGDDDRARLAAGRRPSSAGSSRASSSAKPSSRITPQVRPSDARGAHHGQVVDRAADGEAADVAAGEEDRMDDVRVGGDDEQLVADADRRAVVHRGEADAVERHRGEVADEERSMSARMARPPPPCLSVTRPVRCDRIMRAPRSLQIGNAAVEVPDLAGPFVRDHAGADRVLRHALAVEEPAVVRVLMPAMMSPQMH